MYRKHPILEEFGLPYGFEREVVKAAAHIRGEITPEDLEGRRDYRDVLTFTIDPAEAKDFDDALSLRRLENGNLEVGVHIADVSHYVEPDDPIDLEARDRGTSVYLVDRTVPMLPERLCNDLCSLREGEDRLTFSAVFEMTSEARVRKSWLGKAVICSDHRLDYDSVQALIDDPEKAEGPVGEAVLLLNGLARILRERRLKAGAVNFERPELKFDVDATGKPLRVYKRESAEANWLVEEFMLLANRTVAEFVESKHKVFVYRVHDDPSPERVDALRSLARDFGYKTRGFGKVSSELNSLLSSARGTPEYSTFESLVLRAMARACYSTDNIGHYGLAFDAYTHFTSPIRRYPDLMVHRLLAHYLDGGRSASKSYFETECRYASEREQIATEAERASIKSKSAEYMRSREGQEFEGSISSLAEWGIYVELDGTGIEGMIPLKSIHSDYFDFDEKRFRLSGRRTHRKFRLGDRVKVRVKKVKLRESLIDFELIEDNGK